MPENRDGHLPEPKPVLPYATPLRTVKERAFGSILGNICVGAVILFLSIIASAMIGGRSGLTVIVLTLALGIVATFFSRYRGVLLGMLLVAGGLYLLIASICGF